MVPHPTPKWSGKKNSQNGLRMYPELLPHQLRAICTYPNPPICHIRKIHNFPTFFNIFPICLGSLAGIGVWGGGVIPAILGYRGGGVLGYRGGGVPIIRIPKNVEKKSQNGLRMYPKMFPHQLRAISTYSNPPISHMGKSEISMIFAQFLLVSEGGRSLARVLGSC